MPAEQTASTAPHPTEGWTERRSHADGVSYWRRGERHRATGWAVDREGGREAWLYGRRLAAPDHPEPLDFAGQAADGVLEWRDADGRLRVEQWTTAGGVDETRYLDANGAPGSHPGGYHRVRTLRTGERRYYAEGPTGPVLHRLDGPALEDAGSARRARWYEDGARVASPEMLLDAAKLRALAAWEAGRTPEPMPLAPSEFERIAAVVARNADCELAWELSIAFPSAWTAGIRRSDGARRPPVRG
ncbi:hypothetical protein ACWKWP_14320 [Agromyces soli]